jgi:hypothetical protein
MIQARMIRGSVLEKVDEHYLVRTKFRMTAGARGRAIEAERFTASAPVRDTGNCATKPAAAAGWLKGPAPA